MRISNESRLVHTRVGIGTTTLLAKERYAERIHTTVSYGARRRESKSHPLRIPYVMGVTAIPRGFDTVRRVRCGRDHIVFVSTSGKKVRQSVDLSFFSA